MVFDDDSWVLLNLDFVRFDLIAYSLYHPFCISVALVTVPLWLLVDDFTRWVFHHDTFWLYHTYDILWRWLIVWLNDDFWMSELWQPCEGRRDNVRILFAFDQNGGCPSCACTHVDSDHEVEMWLSLLCASNCVMSVKVISALRLNADVTPRHRGVMQQVVFLDLVLARLTRSW